jgi:hypothetical protein
MTLLAPTNHGRHAASRPGSEPPTISVIIAAYQAAEHIAEAIRSALEQSFPPYEIIVCDDGSIDDTPAVLRSFGEAIRIVEQPNRGTAEARNSAVRAASGEYVAILDADDLFAPGRLQAMASAIMLRPDLDVLTSDALVEIDGRKLGRLYGSPPRFPVTDQRGAILRDNFIFIQTVLRRSLLCEVPFRAGLRGVEDWDCWARILLRGGAVGLIDEPLSVYRVRRSSVSADEAHALAHARGMLEGLRASAALTARERDILDGSVERYDRLHRLAAARIAAAEGAPDARRLWLRSCQARTTARASAPSQPSPRLRLVSPESCCGAGGLAARTGGWRRGGLGDLA